MDSVASTRHGVTAWLFSQQYYGLDKRQEAPRWSLEVRGGGKQTHGVDRFFFGVDDMIFLFCCLLATYTRRGRGGSGLKVESRFGHLRGLERGAQKGLTAVQYTAAGRRD